MRQSAYPTRFPDPSLRSVFLGWGADDIKRACPGGDCSCRSQPRRGPGAPGPSPAPGRLGAGWARSLCFLLAGVAPAAATTAGPSVSPSAWPCPCMLAPAAAAGVSADSAAAGVDGSIGDWSYRPTTSATAAAITGASRVGGDSAPTGAGESASPGSPCNSSAAGPSSDSGSKTKPSSEAAAVPAAGRRDICPNSVESATTATSAPPCSLTPGPTAAASSHKPVSLALASDAPSASSPSAATPSCPACSSCCCSCSRNTSPHRAARCARGDVLDVAVVHTGPAPRVFGTAGLGDWGDVAGGAVCGGGSGHGDAALSTPDRPCAGCSRCRARARPPGNGSRGAGPCLGLPHAGILRPEGGVVVLPC
ncbi:unnamed protein product [Closterium sp. NIES-64]|nr:unnamed protein product [Closterium sp. NIES-64]